MEKSTVHEYASRLVESAPPLDAAQRDVILSAFAGLNTTAAPVHREAA